MSVGGGGNALRATVTVINKKGLHARAAALFVKVAGSFDAEVAVTANGHTVPGTSIMGLLMLGAARGTEIRIVAAGPEAERALEALVRLVANRFEEEDFPGY